MWGAYKAVGKLVGASARVGARAGDSMATRFTLHAQGRGARRGFLAPGDPAPPPTANTDYLDYRGVATWRECAALSGGTFPLGSLIDLRRRKVRGPIGLPELALNRHAVVIGPAGSGKTAGLLVPWMHAALTAGWSVVAVDVKGDLREDFLAYRQQYGGIPGARLRKWDFTDPARSTSWSWIDELTDDARVDAAITAVLGRPPEQGNVDPYFYQRDYRTLRGLLKLARATGKGRTSAGALIAWLDDQRRLSAVLASSPRAPGASDLGAMAALPPGDYAKAVSGVVTALSALDLPDVEAVTATPKLDLEDALDSHHCLIVGAPLRGGQVSATLGGLVLNQLKQRLYERFGQGRRPALVMIDEAAQVADRVDLAQLMEVARSAGAGVVIALQDAAQLRDESDRSSILSNAAAMALLPGASPLSVKTFGERLGQRFERTYGLTASGSGGWGSSPPQQTFDTEAVPVLRDREIAHVPFGERPAVVHVNARELGLTTKPFIVDLYREDG